MKAFIHWSGVLNVVFGAAFQFPAFSARLMPGAAPAVLPRVFGLMAIFLGVMLIFCARDLRHRGVLVAWEGVLRLVGGTLMAGYGLLGDSGLVAILGGLGDFAIGIAYLVGLPRHLGMPFSNLFLDRPTAD